MIVVMLTVKLCQGRHCPQGQPLCMKGNCAMDGRLAFNTEVNIAKVGNFAKDGNVATKSALKAFFIQPRHAAPGTALQTCWVAHL